MAFYKSMTAVMQLLIAEPNLAGLWLGGVANPVQGDSWSVLQT
jgi:hypothetical protein